MKFCSGTAGLVRSLVALFVSFAVVPSGYGFASASSNKSAVSQSQISSLQDDGKLSRVTAILTGRGVLLQWRSNFDTNNLGFNIYRLQGDRRTRINKEIVPGSVFEAGSPVLLRGGGSYSFFDSTGTADSVYYVESMSIDGGSKLYNSVTPIPRKDVPGFEQAGESGAKFSEYSAANTENSGSLQKSFPTAEAEHDVWPAGAIEDQWAVAEHPGLKISIKKDGWYRVTQPQMAAAGFDTSVDISDLRLYSDAQEVAINTSQNRGPLGSGDYIEFYGRGLDVPTSDSRIYYLFAAIGESTPGKRVRGDLHLDSSITLPQPGPVLFPETKIPIGTRSLLFGWIWRLLNIPVAPEPTFVDPVKKAATAAPVIQPLLTPNRSAEENHNKSTPGATKRGSPKKKKKKRKPARERNHVESSAVFAPSSFDYTVERKDRLVYFTVVLNGDAENFFGQVISSSAVAQTINTPNPDFTAGGIARVEIALQGVNSVTHQVDVELQLDNGNATLGSFTYFGVDHPVQVFNVPVSLLKNGANTIKFIPVTGSGVSIVDYVRITYPHTFNADGDTLRFSLRGTQSRKVDGFSTPSVRLIEYTDPFNVRIVKPSVESSGSGYAITVPASSPRSKAPRLFYAFAAGQFQQPAALSFNQPSQLNSGANGADFLLISHQTLLPSAAPLATTRQGQGLSVARVDVEDIYDEFSFGVHGPQAIKSFLAHTVTHWSAPPRYVIFLGDASYDPRKYVSPPGSNFDLVPTKLVDATFSETASDDWLTDFDDDGIANIPVGRLPVRTTAEANLLISKIVDFTPANVPQAALLVADDPTGYYFNFETANDQVQTLLPASMTVQRVNRRTESSDAQAKADIIAGFNQGRALVNYSGHGNVDTWTGASIFTAADATALTNGNKLSFVVVMDCLNGYFQAPGLEGIAEALMKAPNGGAVAVFASSGLTIPDGQHEMSTQLYKLIYGPGSTPIALGDAIKIAKGATTDIDVRRTWIFFGDPSMKIR